ncbi:peptidoglycan-binding protein [Scytonema hofmannii FACHB-248]|uniref:Peptidoglycan-binding protein n=1 Tax=Scytonema hofmannii FACHB-248 TaxID=1842502 RepID=A0ABR8H280_9CYAN|nr:peptidoglycan-binding protein [Scytonema hofmannii]MBD2609118.1 peptidoglycan-binding protein [Scytonema hofmannii FACHB-248]
MKCSQTLSRTNYLPTSIASRFFSASKFYLLPFWFATSVLIGSTAVVSFAAPPEIAQVVVGGSVNRPTLKLGSQGERVSELQGALKLLGYYTGTVDGNFNQMTANAVSQFKQAAGLAPDGTVDGNTWQRLFPGEGTVASSPALPNPASKFPTPNSVTDNATPEPKPSSPSTSQTTVRQSSSGNGTSTSRSEQTLRTTSTDGAGQTSSSEQIVRTTSTTGSGETVRTRQTPRNQTSSSGETVRTRQTPRNQTASSGQTTRTSRQASTSGQTTRTSRQASTSGQTTRTSRQASSSGQTTRQTPSIQYTAGGMPILRIGMRGSEVVKLQERLKRLGFLNGNVDGDFGPSTEAAVKAAQQRYGLESDGIAGGATWDALTRRRSQPL